MNEFDVKYDFSIKASLNEKQGKIYVHTRNAPVKKGRD
jgi:hypothetical protein